MPSDEFGWRVMYTITYDPDARRWNCTCPGHRRHQNDCKHIKRVQRRQHDLKASLALIGALRAVSSIR